MFRKTLAASLLLAVSIASAHHSFQATFTSDRTISVEGVVTDYRFKNPHILIYLDVTGDDGVVTNWMSEGGAATLMRRRGWDRNTISKGQTVRITGNPTHDGSPMVSIESVDLIDPATGSVSQLLGEDRNAAGGQDRGTTRVALKLEDGRVNLSGAWERVRQGPGSGSPQGLDGVPPWNDTGAAVQAAYDRANDPQIFCEPPGLVRQAGFTPHPVRITQHDDRVVFEYEEFGGRRVVYLGDEAIPDGDKSHLGDSIARYEGDALIVESKNLLGNPVQPRGYQHSDQATVVEVYTRPEDNEQFGSVMLAETTVTDPVYLTEPWVLRRMRYYSEGYEFIENDCRPPLRERKTD